MPRQTTDDVRWRTAIADLGRSGLTQPEFCRRRPLPLHTFRRHLYDVRKTITGHQRRQGPPGRRRALQAS